MDVINRGMSGYNTSQCLFQLPQAFLPPGPNVAPIAYVIILLGANDAVINGPTANQGIALSNYRDNLATIATHPIFTAHGASILIVTPPPLNEIHTSKLDLAWGHAAPIRTAKRSAAYSQAAREVAVQTGATVIDLWKGIMNRAVEMCPEWKDGKMKGPPWLGDPDCGLQGGLKELLPDGLHMNGEAYQILASLILKHIHPEWASLENREGYIFEEWGMAPRLEKDKV